MTERTRSEELFDLLSDTLNELSELESPEYIFDYIVDNFAASAEYHLGQANTAKAMLDTFRHDNPAETLPEQSSAPSAEELYGGMNEINRTFMSENQDILEEFMRSVKFPGKLDS